MSRVVTRMFEETWTPVTIDYRHLCELCLELSIAWRCERFCEDARHYCDLCAVKMLTTDSDEETVQDMSLAFVKLNLRQWSGTIPMYPITPPSVASSSIPSDVIPLVEQENDNIAAGAVDGDALGTDMGVHSVANCL